MTTGVLLNLTFLLDGMRVWSSFTDSSLTSLLMSLEIRFSSTPFSTDTMGGADSGFLMVS